MSARAPQADRATADATEQPVRRPLDWPSIVAWSLMLVVSLTCWIVAAVIVARSL